MPECLHYSEMQQRFNSDGYYFQLTLGRTLLKNPHSHDFYEMICVLSGSCVHQVNDADIRCTEGDILLLRPTDVHSFLSQSEATNIAALSVRSSEADLFLRAYGLADTPDWQPAAISAPPCTVIRLLDRAKLSDLCSRIFALSGSERTPLCRVLLGEFFGALIQDGTRERSGFPPSFAATLAEMNLLPNAAEGIGAFLRISNFSHAQLCRLTKKYLAQTPGEYVNTVRMRYAWELVLAGELDFETICETVGFASYSYFCRLFTRTYGATPAKVRNSRRSGERTI